MAFNLRNYTLHILWILVFLSIPIVTSPDLGSNMIMVSGFRRNFAAYVLLVLFFYLNYYYFVPRYYLGKRYFLFAAIMFFSYVMIICIPDWLFGFQQMRHMGPPQMPPQGMPPGGMENMNGMPNMRRPGPGMFFMADGGSVFQFLLVLILSVMLRIRNQLRMIQSEKLKAEVSYLKAQMNPHFLFNTLNSLYALTIQKSDAAPDAVLKLSNLMRYVVTESSSDLVPLEKEINYIKDYIAMQKLRIVDHSRIIFTVNGETNGKQIAPLMLIPFIENAFKYGVNAEEDWLIIIGIDIREKDFILEVRNNKVNISIPPDEASETGIDNTRKRLEYVYPAQHELTVNDLEHSFDVRLKIHWV